MTTGEIFAALLLQVEGAFLQPLRSLIAMRSFTHHAAGHVVQCFLKPFVCQVSATQQL